jgi:hypothetical protein
MVGMMNDGAISFFRERRSRLRFAALGELETQRETRQVPAAADDEPEGDCRAIAGSRMFSTAVVISIVAAEAAWLLALGALAIRIVSVG